MQIKIFENSGDLRYGELEAEVNEYIKDKRVTEIQYKPIFDQESNKIKNNILVIINERV